MNLFNSVYQSIYTCRSAYFSLSPLSLSLNLLQTNCASQCMYILYNVSLRVSPYLFHVWSEFQLALPLRRTRRSLHH